MNTINNLLHILGNTIQKKEIEYKKDLNIEELYDLATKQGVWHIIFETLKKQYDVSKYEMKFLTVISKNITSNEFVYKTVQRLEENGIECCYLKGIAVARFYPNSECRVSGDTDILIDPEKQGKAIEILKSMDYYVEEEKENHHHIQASHKMTKLLEVHNMLYSKPTRDIIFKGHCGYDEEYMEIESSVGKIKTLGINDGLLYLTVHFIKHFLNSNVNLRQMVDLLLYMRHYNDQIRWEEYNKLMQELKYHKLIDTIKAVGNIYFGMDFETVVTDVDDFLKDFEEERPSVYNYYCSAKTDMNKIEYAKYMENHGEQGRVLKRIFPEREVMKRIGYDNIDSFMGLMMAYLKRVFWLMMRSLKKKEEGEENREKKELLKKLGML